MYPNRPSKSLLLIAVSVVFLITVSLVSGSNKTSSAQAYFSPLDAETYKQSNLTSIKPALDVNAQSIQASIVEVRVSAQADDAEQRLSSGSVYLDSSDLELIKDPEVAKGDQVVGIRFTNVSIPRGATITNAYVEFQVDEASNEATSLVLRGEAVNNSAAFSTTPRDISKRVKTSASISWDNLPAWNTVGAKVQSPNISAVVQEIVNRNGWASGNSLSLIIKGTGSRVATAFEGGAAGAPLLHVEYLPSGSTPTPTLPQPTSPAPTSTPVGTTPPPAPTNTPTSTEQGYVVNVRVSASANDAEQRVSDGFMYLDSSDLEMVTDPDVTNGVQSVGMRFTAVNIPRGAIITNAYLQFKVDEATSENTSLVIRGQAVDNAGAFTTTAYNISNRAKTSASVNWNNIPAWNTVGATIQSPNLASVIQEIVNRGGWSSGNSLALFMDGAGRRVSTSYESNAPDAPLLHVVYLPVVATNTPVSPSPTPPPDDTYTIDVRVSSALHDAEERLSDGFMYVDSSDLELVTDPGVTSGTQGVGMRFTGVNIPQGATITNAYLEFTVDEATSETTSLRFYGQDADNAGAFSTAAHNVCSRTKTSASVSWNNVPAWNTVGARVQSPNLAGIIQEVVDRGGWSSGNSLVILIDGSGRRVSTTYETGPSNAPLLHVEYVPSGGPMPTPTPSPTPDPDNPIPVGQDSNWNLVFRDEFDTGTLDTSKWHKCFWWADTTCTIETNNEMQLYNPEDVLVQNGLLRLRAQKRDMYAWNGELYHYTSGMVMTGGRSGKIPPGFVFTYGYAEAMVKVPAGQGLWPAFWMLPVSYESRPEIDIMEILGHEPNVYHMNYHYIGGDDGQTWTGPDFSAGWHVLGLEWRSDAIIWYVDGVERWRFTDQANISNEDSYLLLNLAVGGNWPGPPDDSTPFPSYYEIEYVRVWQR